MIGGLLEARCCVESVLCVIRRNVVNNHEAVLIRYPMHGSVSCMVDLTLSLQLELDRTMHPRHDLLKISIGSFLVVLFPRANDFIEIILNFCLAAIHFYLSPDISRESSESVLLLLLKRAIICFLVFFGVVTNVGAKVLIVVLWKLWLFVNWQEILSHRLIHILHQPFRYILEKGWSICRSWRPYHVANCKLIRGLPLGLVIIRVDHAVFSLDGYICFCLQINLLCNAHIFKLDIIVCSIFFESIGQAPSRMELIISHHISLSLLR